MKKLQVKRLISRGLTSAAAILMAVIAIGCTTTNPQTGQNEFDPVKTEQVKAALEPVITQGVRRVLAHNKSHAAEIAQYVGAAGHVFCEMDRTGNFEPSYLITELDKLVAPNIGDDYLLSIKDAAIALYRINYAQRFTAELPENEWPRQVANLFCQAITRGLLGVPLPAKP
jgi:hypothetical protein